MSILELFILAVGLSMDAFAVSICKGLSLGKINIRHMTTAGIWFGGFQALMPVIGYFLGGFFKDYITAIDHWIAFALPEEEMDNSMTVGTMFVLAVATSIDALAVGITFAFLDVNIAYAVVFIGMITFLFSVFGVKIGSIFGAIYKSKAEIFGGIVLILIGAKIVLEHTGILQI